ncbi:MAG: glycosyltransferase family 4 protein [Kiritimatiellia bacterium]
MTEPGRKRIRVMHVIPSLALGGTPRLMLDLVANLQKTGNFENHICVLGCSEQTCGKYAPAVDPVYFEDPCRYRRPLQMMRLMLRLQSHIREVAPDIVHSYLWLADVLAAAAVYKTESLHVSHVVDRRKGSATPWKHHLKKNMMRYFLRRADTRFVAVSAACRDYVCRYLDVPARKVSLAYNSIDPELFSFNEHLLQRPFKIGSGGRMVEEKGFAFLLAAARLLKDQGVDFRLLLDGDGPLRPSLERRARKLKIDDCVEFRGFLPSMADFYKELDVFVVSSVDAEGLPTTLLEAMASGCAIVATDVGGSSEAVRNGREGLIVPPRSARAIADSIEAFVNNEELRNSCVQAARERVVSMFTLDRMTADVVRAYDDAFGKTVSRLLGGRP